MKNYKIYIYSITLIILGFASGFCTFKITNTVLKSNHINNYNDKFRVCFTPPFGCEQIIIDEIDKAKNNILIQAYGFTSKSIAQALIDARARNIEVKIILDKTNLRNKYSQYLKLKDVGAQINFDSISAIAHNKIIIIDNHKVITGSYNFTDAANYRNAENIIVIDDHNVALKYLDNWFKRKAESNLFFNKNIL